MSLKAMEASPQAPPPEFPGSDPEDEWLCFRCLGGTCRHGSGHEASAVTMLLGTALCGDCARALAAVPWYR